MKNNNVKMFHIGTILEKGLASNPKANEARKKFVWAFVQHNPKIGAWVYGVRKAQNDNFNYGDVCECLVKAFLGLRPIFQPNNGNTREQMQDCMYGDIKAVDNYATCSKGYTNSKTTYILANTSKYKGVYKIATSEIVWTTSGKMQRAQTLAKAHKMRAWDLP